MEQFLERLREVFTPFQPLKSSIMITFLPFSVKIGLCSTFEASKYAQAKKLMKGPGKSGDKMTLGCPQSS